MPGSDPKAIQTLEEFEAILVESREKPVLLVKLSPVCPTSYYAERNFRAFLDVAPEELACYTIDVIASRPEARGLAERIGVRHESPQALLLRDGACVWHDSHSSLTTEALLGAVRTHQKA